MSKNLLIDTNQANLIWLVWGTEEKQIKIELSKENGKLSHKLKQKLEIAVLSLQVSNSKRLMLAPSR